jgi:hypothetical protein
LPAPGFFCVVERKQGVFMSEFFIVADLIDVRCKVTEETNQVLEAMAAGRGVGQERSDPQGVA